MADDSELRDELEAAVQEIVFSEIQRFLSDIEDIALGALSNNTIVAAGRKPSFSIGEVKKAWNRRVPKMMKRLRQTFSGYVDTSGFDAMEERLEDEYKVPDRAYDIVSEGVQAAVDEGATTTELSDTIASLTGWSRAGIWASIGAAIAVAEATLAYNRHKNKTLAEQGFDSKMWYTQEDSRVRDSHADAHGQVVPIDGEFLVGGYNMRYPGDRNAPIEEVINCRCVLLEVKTKRNTTD